MAAALVVLTLVGGMLYRQGGGGVGITAEDGVAPALPSDPTPCPQGGGDIRCATPPSAGPTVDLESGSPNTATELVQPLVDPVEPHPSAASLPELASPLTVSPVLSHEPAASPPIAASVKSVSPASGMLDVSWLKQQPGDSFTLQLMVSSQVETLRKLAQEKQLAEPLAVASFTQEGKVLHALLQGSHVTRGAAESAAEGLRSATGLTPWVRAFSSLPPLLYENAPLPARPATAGAPGAAPAMAGAAWLWSRNPGRYTLQLFGAGSDSAILAYVSQHQLRGELGLVTVQRAGKPWKLLLLGEYESAEAANQALAALPNEWKGSSPWGRTFASLQDEMMNPARAPR